MLSYNPRKQNYLQGQKSNFKKYINPKDTKLD